MDLVWLQLLSQPPRAEGTLTTLAWEGTVGHWGPATLENQGGFLYPKKLRLACLPNMSFGIIFFFGDCVKNHTIFCSILNLAWWHWLVVGDAGSYHMFGFMSCLELSLHAMETHYWELLETPTFTLRQVILGLFELLSSPSTRQLPTCSLK